MEIKLSEKLCYMAALRGFTYYETLIFVLMLRSLHRHPILLNFRSNTALYRKQLHIGDIRFKRLMKSAIALKLASFEGNHLRLVGHNFEKSAFKATRRFTVQAKHLKQYFQVSVLKHNISQQQSAISHKATNETKDHVNSVAINPEKPFAKVKINTVTLSVRLAAKLLGLPISTAYDTLRSLENFGLTFTQNKVSITKRTFRNCLSRKRPNIRYDHVTKEYFYILAQSPVLTRFKTAIKVDAKVVTGNYYDQDYW